MEYSSPVFFLTPFVNSANVLQTAPSYSLIVKRFSTYIEWVTNAEHTTNSGIYNQDVSKIHNDENRTAFIAAAQKKADKDKKRKNNRKTEISLESSSSHSENSSSSDDSFEDDNSNKSHRFQLSLNLRGTNGSFLVK